MCTVLSRTQLRLVPDLKKLPAKLDRINMTKGVAFRIDYDLSASISNGQLNKQLVFKERCERGGRCSTHRNWELKKRLHPRKL